MKKCPAVSGSRRRRTTVDPEQGWSKRTSNQKTPKADGVDFEAVKKRVTRDLINSDVRIVGMSGLSSESKCYDTFYNGSSGAKVSFDQHERLAANYYESKGWTVLRLGHFSLQGVGHLEHKFKESALLGESLRAHLPAEVYQRITLYARQKNKPVGLEGVDPRLYPVVFYPPDFLLIGDEKRFRFAEVKGPRDRLGLRQANWFLHSLPADWGFEILALIRDEVPTGEFFKRAHGDREGPKFAVEFEGWVEKVERHVLNSMALRRRFEKEADRRD